MTINDICQKFEMGGTYISCVPVSNGNINSTFHARYIRDGERKGYIIQRINKRVFTNPEELMDNIVRVTDYVHENIVKMGLSTRKFVMHVFRAREGGEPYIIDNFGEYWRCYRFIDDSVTYDSTDDLEIINSVGLAFGRFQTCLNGFDASTLHITIKDFHNTKKRYEDFETAIKEDKVGRVSHVKEEINFLLENKEKAIVIQDLLDKKEIPLRVTHNDTKCNNVSFDKNTKEALSVLDLDTVMPGAIAFDFGDGVRSIASTVVEDDPNIENVALDLKKYESFTAGFVGIVKEHLTEKEIETLNDGVIDMTLELASRFLADYINGDIYFKNNYPGHNLDRARNQIALAKDMIKKRKQLDEILGKIVKEK